MDSALDALVAALLNRQASELVEKIADVDYRLSTLGDGEEDRLEAIVLGALRRHLVRELEEIVGFADELGFHLEPKVSARAHAIVEA